MIKLNIVSYTLIEHDLSQIWGNEIELSKVESQDVQMRDIGPDILEAIIIGSISVLPPIISRIISLINKKQNKKQREHFKSELPTEVDVRISINGKNELNKSYMNVDICNGDIRVAIQNAPIDSNIEVALEFFDRD